MSNENKTRLSKSILEMKFMKRSKEKAEKEIFDVEGEEYFGNHLTAYMKKQTGQFIIEPSFVFCEQLIEGRLSFQGMNPELERLMELEAQDKVKEEVTEDADISDSEMADRFRKFKKIKAGNPDVKSVHKKWVKTEEMPVQEDESAGNEEVPIQNRKPKFLKPKD